MSTLPSISINFINQAATFAARSASGIMLIALKKDEFKAASDPAETEGAVYEFYSAAEVTANTNLNAIHKKGIKFAFYQGGAPKKVIVAVAAVGSDAVAAAQNYNFSWACAMTETHNVFEAVFANAIITLNSQNSRQIKVCINDDVPTTGTPSVAADDHVVRVKKGQLLFNNGTEDIPAAGFYMYLPRICATFCNTPITESASYKVFGELKRTVVTTDAGNNVALVFRDGFVRMTRAITSSGKSVAIIEARDLITEDIYLTWVNFFLGKKRNTKSNELSFCAQILGYIRKLQEQGVVNPDEEVVVEQDIDAMREAHAAYYQDHDDAWVANHPYGNECYIKCSLRLVDVMESLTFQVYLGE